MNYGICYKMNLPLKGSHNHLISPQTYWETRLNAKVSKRAKVLIRQGLCHRQVLNQMLLSFIENELVPEHELPSVRKYTSLVYFKNSYR